MSVDGKIVDPLINGSTGNTLFNGQLSIYPALAFFIIRLRFQDGCQVPARVFCRFDHKASFLSKSVFKGSKVILVIF
jgi:hypothetical protein